MQQRFFLFFFRSVVPFLAFPLAASLALAEEAAGEGAETVSDHLFDPVDASRSRVVPVKVYLPAAKSPAAVVLFSHGLGGSREGAAYLGEYWAEAGFVAVFMQHAGSDADVWRGVALAERMKALRDAASVRSFRDRVGDVSFILDQLERWNGEKGHALAGRLDLEHMGMAGHSFGGVTTQAAMGKRFPFNRSFIEPRIDAFLVLSPSVGKGVTASRAFGHIDAPVFCMTGTEDNSPLEPGENVPASRREVYTALPDGDKYELVFEGGDHMVFSGREAFGSKAADPRCHPAVQKLSTAFWKAYLRSDAEAKTWLQSDLPVKELNLDPKDVWRWK